MAAAIDRWPIDWLARAAWPSPATRVYRRAERERTAQLRRLRDVLRHRRRHEKVQRRGGGVSDEAGVEQEAQHAPGAGGIGRAQLRDVAGSGQAEMRRRQDDERGGGGAYQAELAEPGRAEDPGGRNRRDERGHLLNADAREHPHAAAGQPDRFLVNFDVRSLTFEV